MKSWILLLALVAGCAGLEPAQDPVIAGAGLGVTVWKVPVVGIGGWGPGGYGVAPVIVHQYNYQAQPAPVPPGTPPSPPSAPSAATPPAPPVPPVPYRTVYESKWDDPTLVIFVSLTPRVVRIKIDDQPEIGLAGYQATADLSVGIGEHKVRLTYEKPTASFGVLEDVRFLSLSITPWRRPYPIPIPDL